MLRKIKKNNKQTIILQRIAVAATATRLRENSRPAPDQCFGINSQTDYTLYAITYGLVRIAGGRFIFIIITIIRRREVETTYT